MRQPQRAESCRSIDVKEVDSFRIHCNLVNLPKVTKSVPTARVLFVPNNDRKPNSQNNTANTIDVRKAGLSLSRCNDQLSKMLLHAKYDANTNILSILSAKAEGEPQCCTSA